MSEAAPERNEPQDQAPRAMSFPNASGGSWRKPPDDKAPRGPGLRSSVTRHTEETPAQRRRKIERRVGKLYMGGAKGLDKLGADYPAQVLVSQSKGFVDSVMAMSDEHPRILEWLDSDLAVAAHWQFATIVVGMGVMIAAYYGFAPEFAAEIVGDVLDMPPLPAEDQRVIVVPRKDEEPEAA
jgi:hypothetical protein